MSKEKQAVASPLLRELTQAGIYKRNQGRIARQITFGVIALVVAIGCWRLSVFLIGQEEWLRVGVPVLLAAAGIWFTYRLVNMPRFADFLIAVEAEMNKVSWPTRTELIRSSLVVIFCIFFLAGILFAYDVFWNFLLKNVLHVLQGS